MGMTLGLGLLGAGLGMAGSVAGSLSENQQKLAQSERLDAQAKALRQNARANRLASQAEAESIGERKSKLRREYEAMQGRNAVRLGAGNVDLASGSAMDVAAGNADIFAQDVAENSYQKMLRIWEGENQSVALENQARQANAQSDYLSDSASYVAPTLLKAGLAGAGGFLQGYSLAGGNLFGKGAEQALSPTVQKTIELNNSAVAKISSLLKGAKSWAG